jgi:hypothetical protein
MKIEVISETSLPLIQTSGVDKILVHAGQTVETDETLNFQTLMIAHTHAANL